MNKNIFIIGAARSGKTTLSRKINKEMGYSIVNLDDIISAFETSFPDLGIKHNGNEIEMAKKFAPFLNGYLRELSEGPNFYNDCKFVIEGTHIDFEQVIPKIDKDKYVLIGLVYNNITSEQLYENIKKYDTEDDWTYWVKEEDLKNDVQYFINRNKYLNDKFIEYNIKTYDVSFDREGSFKNIINQIKEN